MSSGASDNSVRFGVLGLNCRTEQCHVLCSVLHVNVNANGISL